MKSVAKGIAFRASSFETISTNLRITSRIEKAVESSRWFRFEKLKEYLPYVRRE